MHKKQKMATSTAAAILYGIVSKFLMASLLGAVCFAWLSAPELWIGY